MIPRFWRSGGRFEGAHSGLQGALARGRSQLQGRPDSPLASAWQAPSGGSRRRLTPQSKSALCRSACAQTLYGCVGYLYLAPDACAMKVVQTREWTRNTDSIYPEPKSPVMQAVGSYGNAANTQREIKTSHATYHLLASAGRVSDLVNYSF